MEDTARRADPMSGRRCVVIVLDGVGVGALPDASDYGDDGANTLGNTARCVGGIDLPNLSRLGLGRIVQAPNVRTDANAEGCFGRMAERSAGKDSTTGHWELAGLITSRAFPVYPNGFPADLLRRFCAATGCSGVLGNKPASGTEIINELGDEHVRTGSPIVYTSGDSVFQIAAHEAVIPPGRLYEICRMTRESVVVGEHAVGRVIARPFVGTSGAYTRTSGRKDFALEPGGTTVFDLLFRAGVETVGIGKIEDLFSGRGLARAIHTVSNADGITRTLEELRHLSSGFMMTNLVDFDMLFGHRQDPEGFAGALRQFDDALPALRTGLHDGDLLILTADHGNDPTDKSTDHTREFVPLLCVSPSGKRNIALGDRATFADLGKTIAEFFGVPAPGLAGESFLGSIR